MMIKEGINIDPKNLRIEKRTAKIDAYEVYYRELNTMLRSFNGNGIEKIEL